MIPIPEELDNKPFRLFVQRTWHAMQKNLTLTPMEALVARLIADHPEVGLFLGGREIDTSLVYGADEHNPFILLAALVEVQQQVSQDRPAGMQQLFASLLAARLSEAEARRRLAIAWLEWYRSAREATEPTPPERYLLTLQVLLGDPDETPDPFAFTVRTREEGGGRSYSGRPYDQAYAALRGDLYGEAGSAPLERQIPYAHLLERLPREWIQAMADFWHLPKRRLKRDHILDLQQWFAAPGAAAALAGALEEAERACLADLLAKGGICEYEQLAAKFGSEEGDDYWWSRKPPVSTIGRLRLMGLLFVGRDPAKSQAGRIVMIPEGLVQQVEAALRAE